MSYITSLALLGLLQLEISGCVIDQLTSEEIERILARNAAQSMMGRPIIGNGLYREARNIVGARGTKGPFQKRLSKCAQDILNSYYAEREAQFNLDSADSSSDDDRSLHRCRCHSHNRRGNSSKRKAS